MAARPKKRKFGLHDGVFALSKKFVLNPMDAEVAPEGDRLIEPVWDGLRVLATRSADEVRVAAADFRDWTSTFPWVARALEKLPAQSFAIDGVVCVLDPRAAPSFAELRTRVAEGRGQDAVLLAWDLMWLDGTDLRERPLTERRAHLAKLLEGAPGAIALSQSVEAELSAVLPACAALGIHRVLVRALQGSYGAPWRVHGAPLGPTRSLSPAPPLTNAEKVLYPKDGITKREVVDYYRELAPTMLPYLLDRPVVIQRWPDGILEFDWYQHRVPPRAPDYLRPAWVDGVRRVVIESPDALLWMVNQAGLTYHVFSSRLRALSAPDYVVIDLDPGDRASWWAELIEIALALRRLLELLELPSVVKTSGQRGLHVLIPLAPGHRFGEAEELARGVAWVLERLLPDKVTLELEKQKRGGRLLVDHQQFLAKTLVAPYSLRGVHGAAVSAPISWEEVGPTLDPSAFSLRTMLARLEKKGDLAAPLLEGRAVLASALAQLRRTLGG